MAPTRSAILTILLGLTLGMAGCFSASSDSVTVYSALDRNFSEPVFDSFQESQGIQVLAKYDTESTKTVGLANQILQQSAGAGGCDLFWNNEILHTLRLEAAGKLRLIPSELLNGYPDSFRSTDGRWVGLAARARIIVANTDRLDPERVPKSIMDLADPQWKGQACLAKPLFGTTATHFAVLYQQLGEQAFTDFVQQLIDNDVAILSGNRQVAADVASGKYVFGFTDTDDFNLEKQAGQPVQLIWPDQESSQAGTLLLPNTLCLPVSGVHQRHAETLLGYLLAGEIETRLAKGPSAQFPLKEGVVASSPLLSDPAPRWQEVEWDKVLNAWEKSSEILKQKFY